MADINPLNLINKYFPIELWNPNPKMSALKSGDRFTLTFEVDKETFDLFCGAPNEHRAGMILEGALRVSANHGAIGTCDDDGELIVPGSPPAPAQQKADGGEFAQQLFRTGYFNNPHLWRALEKACVYTPAKHYGLIRTKPCICASPKSNQQFHAFIGRSKPIPCNGDVTWHHVRTAENSGTGIKPSDFITVPVCDAHHRAAHDHQSRHLNEWLLMRAGTYRAEGIKEAIKATMGLTSFSEATPALLKNFHDLIDFKG